MSIPALILVVSSVVSLQAAPEPAATPPSPVSPSGVPIRPPARERQVRNEEVYKPSSVKVRQPEIEGAPATDAAPAADATGAPAPDAAPAAPAPAATPATSAPATPATPARTAPIAAAPTNTLGPTEFAVLGVLAIVVLAPMVLGVWWIVSSRADSSSSHSM